jgi:hypothetical protein
MTNTKKSFEVWELVLIKKIFLTSEDLREGLFKNIL